jgi:type I restriction enzyme S subunit
MTVDRNILPSSWATATIGQLIGNDGIFIDGDWVESKDQDPDGSVRLIQLADIGDADFRDKSRRFLTLEKAHELHCTFLEHGDILIARMPDPLGRCCIFPMDRKEGFVTVVDVCVVRVGSAPIDTKFLMYAVNSGQVRTKIADLQSGSTRKRISRGNLATIEIPLAPYKEQQRIVAKLEELFSELNKGVESLTTAREQLKAYRQAVLKHAYEGKLTAQWRDENRDKVESADRLFKRIKNERELHYQTKIVTWNTAADENGGKPRPPKPLATLGSRERDELPVLPDSWIWEKLGWMTCGVEYGTAAKSSESGLVPVLRMGNIQNAKFDWSDLVYASDEDEIRKYALKAGDVLFNRTNSPELVGKTAIYRGERPALFAGYLIRVNQIPSIVDSQYLNLFLNSHIARQQGNRVKTDGVNQSNINGAKLSNYAFPYCSLAEQREIVKRLEEKLSLIDQLEEEVEQAIRKSEALRQSILQKAFFGQLVVQDPNDEPALVLLERIRVESEGNSNSRKKSNKNNNDKKEAA